ncbi:YneF family protein [Atopobacter sp. AH10]|uniref:YneF family protein n=1 Tax=Atopobacter sp. AH10 TaxID=2315861 RepID=UPI000EF1F5D2|nr:YneF family protein [Atopobacter sp. AH10]RLK62511.1 YneF family protein [Atopobacter sp. AH10]
MSNGMCVFLVIVALMVGAVLGFFGARRYMIKYFQEHPPIDENMLRTIMIQMGQKPSERKIRQMANAIKLQSKAQGKK